MKVAELLSLDQIVSGVSASSKKRALQLVGAVLAEAVANEELSDLDIFDGLIARERLGSTGLGHGVAIPHGRFENLDRAVAVLIKLDRGIDFDAIDDDPVDLLFGLMVPKESTEEHLQLLASMAEMFSDAELRQQLRQCDSSEAMFSLIESWCSPDQKLASDA